MLIHKQVVQKDNLAQSPWITYFVAIRNITPWVWQRLPIFHGWRHFCQKFHKKKTLFARNLQECRMWNGWRKIKYIKFPLTFLSLLQYTHTGWTVNSTPPASIQWNSHRVIIMQLQTSVLCLVLLFLAAHDSHRIVSPNFLLNWVKQTDAEVLHVQLSLYEFFAAVDFQQK